MNYNSLLDRLEKPRKPVSIVLDTDAYNEIDDQFAIAYLLSYGEKLHLKAIYAAPFFDEKRIFGNFKSNSPLEGMNESYNEILRLLKLTGHTNIAGNVFKGSDRFLESENVPVLSEAATDLAERAMNYSESNPLYLVAIGAITNIASALLLNPEIKNRIVIIWLGGNAHHWHDCKEFNLWQDISAARVVFSSGAALVQLPCMGVVSAFSISGIDLSHWLSNKNQLCDYLLENTLLEIKGCYESFISRAIWDVTAVAWLLNSDFMLERIVPAPLPGYDGFYSFEDNRHPIKYIYHINKDNLFRDLFAQLGNGLG